MKSNTLEYRVAEIPSEIGGRGFAITKPSGPTYHILIDHRHASCECMGFLRWESHGILCKHIRMAFSGKPL